MEDLTCKNCGASMREGDIFCRKCGFKSQAPEAGFCHKCGNALRTGAKFCDLCGAECSPEPGRPKRGRGRGGRGWGPLVFIALCVVIAASAFAAYKFALIPRRAVDPPAQEIPAADVPGDAPPQAGDPPGSADVAPSDDINDDYIPIPDENAAPVSTEVSQTAGAGSVEAGPISAETQASPGTESAGDLDWTERDVDGYSFLAPRDRFLSADEIVSLPGIVSGDHVRVRSRPNTKGSIRRQLDGGVSLDVTRRYSSGQERYYWFQVHYGKSFGWIYGEFLNVENTGSEVPGFQPPPPAQPTPSRRPAQPPGGKATGADTTQPGGTTMIRTKP
jgi:hypothetical protein